MSEVVGIHNQRLETESIPRLMRGNTYQNLSTMIVTPTRQAKFALTIRFAQGVQSLMRPMNQACLGPMYVTGHEVGVAYNQFISQLLSSGGLTNWRYLLTYEDDIIPPPDGLLKLYEAIEGGVCICGKGCVPPSLGSTVPCGRKYDVVQGLYWTKGELGQPMIYGDPDVFPMNMVPQVPRPNTVQHCNGLGMGFNLFRLEMFADRRFQFGNWFKTEQSWDPVHGGKGFTQDLFFYNNALALGYKFACDTRVLVGHYDVENDIVW